MEKCSGGNFKAIGDVQKCGNCREIKLISHMDEIMGKSSRIKVIS